MRPHQHAMQHCHNTIAAQHCHQSLAASAQTHLVPLLCQLVAVLHQRNQGACALPHIDALVPPAGFLELKTVPQLLKVRQAAVAQQRLCDSLPTGSRAAQQYRRVGWSRHELRLPMRRIVQHVWVWYYSSRDCGSRAPWRMERHCRLMEGRACR